MTPDHIAQLVLYLLCLAAVIWRKHLAEFLDACSDGNVEKLERIEEARAWLAVMNERRVA